MIDDLCNFVKSECSSFEMLEYGVRYVRSRPYSRIYAIVYSKDFPNLKVICMLGPRSRFSAEGVIYYDYVRHTNVCRKSSVTVYRAALDEIRPGDWVYIERGLAEDHAVIHGLKVYSKVVDISDVVWAGTEPREFFYVPEELQGRFSSLYDFYIYCLRS